MSDNSIKAQKISQWLDLWNDFSYESDKFRKKPSPHFYLFSLTARMLKSLSGIARRDISIGERSSDLGIQRKHDVGRSQEIKQFVRGGHPWSSLSERNRSSGDYNDLKKPGWLPTAIIVNILEEGNKRGGNIVAEGDLVIVKDKGDSLAEIHFPEGAKDPLWTPKKLHPIEIIDGQHRLWAFEDFPEAANYQLPIVAFHVLDIIWQAYLFWTINIKPKRINPSLAYDLFPLLRTEDWLEKSGLQIYRETRAQEIVDNAWAYTESPWYRKINMLGDSEYKGFVSQSAWIRTLTSTFLKNVPPSSKGKAGGLFGSFLGQNKENLPWCRIQQAALIVTLGEYLFQEFDLKNKGKLDAFEKSCLLNTDQGIRGIFAVYNDFLFLKADALKLKNWELETDFENDTQNLTEAIKSLKEQPFLPYIQELATELAKFDWRSASHPDLNDDERTQKRAFRGSGGYKELRIKLLQLLAQSSSRDIKDVAETLLDQISGDNNGSE